MKRGFLLLMLFVAFPVTGQVNPDQEQVRTKTVSERFGLFESDDILDITLKFDLTTYFRNKPKTEHLPANITFHISENDSLSRDIRLKTRGVFRNSFCLFAPIELNFKKADFGYSDLDSISKLKLVTQCRSGTLNADYILREYIAYKLFNVLTDTSFRVRLLTITYIDTGRERRPIHHYGIFLEPVEMLTARVNSLEIKSGNLTQRNIVPSVMDRMAIFNYMIGNYDWSIPGRHNVKIIKPQVPDPSAYAISIPYDFDWTGLVDPSYALPVETTGLESVRERLFTGICRSRETYSKRLETFSVKKDEFYKVINETPYINQRTKKDMINYLEGFFTGIGPRGTLIEYMLETCKKF